MFAESFEFLRNQCLQVECEVPAQDRNDRGVWILWLNLLINDTRPSKQGAPQLFIDFQTVSIDASGHQEGKDDLMGDEKTSGDIQVKCSCDSIDQYLQPFFQGRLLRTLFNSRVEQPLDIGQRVLIHGIYASQVSNNEVQYAATSGYGPVLIPRDIDLFLDNSGRCKPFSDIRRSLLRVFQYNDEVVLVEDLFLGGLSEEFKYRVLDLYESVLVTVHANYNVVSFTLDLGLLLNDNVSQHLFFQAHEGHCEVYYR